MDDSGRKCEGKVRERARLTREAEARRAKRHQAVRAILETINATRAAPRGHDGMKADTWVTKGVRQLAGTCPGSDHVVLMAASQEFTGQVGVASSIRCDPMVVMSALGRLVGEVNESFERDGVEVKLTLRMQERQLPVPGDAGAK